MLAARRCLLDKLRKVGQERKQLLAALGLQLLQTPQEQWAQALPVQHLQTNMGQERAASSAFLFSTVDEVTMLAYDTVRVHRACTVAVHRSRGSRSL